MYGRRKGTTNRTRQGRRTGARKWRTGEACRPLDIGTTVNSAIARRAQTHITSQNDILAESDLYLQVRSQKSRRLIVFTIDTSDSMGDGPAARMSAALGAIISLAANAYLNRDQVSLVTFRDHDAALVVPPTNSITLIRQQLNHLPIGGATPLTAGLVKALQVIEQARHKNPCVTPLLVLISDGKATIPLNKGKDPNKEALATAHEIYQAGIPALVINTLSAHRQESCMPQLAEVFGSTCHHIHNLQARQVLELIEESESTLSS